METIQYLIDKNDIKEITGWEISCAASIIHKFKISKENLIKMTKEDAILYLKGLSLFGLELSVNWSKGLELLKKIGFKQKNKEKIKNKMIFVYAK